MVSELDGLIFPDGEPFSEPFIRCYLNCSTFIGLCLLVDQQSTSPNWLGREVLTRLQTNHDKMHHECFQNELCDANMMETQANGKCFV